MTTTSAVDAAAPGRPEDDLLEARFDAVRSYSESIVDGLPVEDLVPQSMEDASPLKWHLAHTSWFFETFLLRQSLPGYRPLRDEYAYLFNSYYNAVGPQYSRPQRGMITRPTVADVLEYRAYVNQHMARLFDTVMTEELEPVVVLGLNHEQQHQELMLTDVKHLFAQNPLLPELRPGTGAPSGLAAAALEWVEFPEGVYSVGTDVDEFHFDNEGPRHQVYLRAFELASRPVTNEEYLAFIDDGGYERSSLWLSSGWSTAQSEGWRSPLYWDRRGGDWMQFTLGGERPLDLAAPVTHISHYEADAYARWAGMRLPTEFEWEVAATVVPIAGNFADSGGWQPTAAASMRSKRHPAAAGPSGGLSQMYGDVWEWTSSAYLPYPGFYASDDAIGEYNGKFMSNQMVLRGGSVATPDARHVRPSYRNFFPPDTRWQFSGIRLARDV